MSNDLREMIHEMRENAQYYREQNDGLRDKLYRIHGVTMDWRGILDRGEASSELEAATIALKRIAEMVLKPLDD